MLSFTRRCFESLIIGDDIVVKVVRYDESKGTVDLGIEAPKSVPVNREEVYKSINEPTED